jgi:hypothetical protein
MKTVPALAILGLIVLSACTEAPVYNLSNSFAIEISAVSKNQEAIKLDILWVVDNSSSMCQEQGSLARGFDAFVDQLNSYLNVDINLAVVTTDVGGSAGVFANNPVKEFPPACGEGTVEYCTKDSDCEARFGANWVCNSPGGETYPWLQNMNGSLNTSCRYRCTDEAACCGTFCYSEECGEDQTCFDELCADLPQEECNYECKAIGGVANATCVGQPNTADCPDQANLNSILTNKEIEYFHCIATVGADQTSTTANLESGLKAAWLALDPKGPNAKQVQNFLREDAYLVVVFISDEDDCSVDDSFCSPSYVCDDARPCPGDLPCVKADEADATGLCCGVIKKQYFSACSLLGEYKGGVHHDCAYDLACSDCETDEDCSQGWACKKVKYGTDKYSRKCRPNMFEFSSYASEQSPAGTPLFALAPVDSFYARLRSLKADPAKVLVTSIVGDAILKESDTDSLISPACLANAKILDCVEYQTVLAATTDDCSVTPDTHACLELKAARTDCARECYTASKGETRNPESGNTYICSSPFGKADLGNRYVKLARMFGPNGIVANICSEQGIGPSLNEMAELIIRRVTKICLPKPIKEGETITVIKNYKEDGVRKSEILKEGDAPEGDYRILYPTQDCPGTFQAVTFNQVMEPSWVVELKYQADVPLD